MKKILKRTTISLLTIGLIGKLLLWFPQPVFANKIEYRNYTVYSNKEVKGDIEKVFNSVTDKVKRCENFDSNHRHKIFLSEPETFYNKFMFTENDSYAYNSTFQHNILIFPIADFEKNTVTRPGSETSYYLDQLIAHEITHTFVTGDLPFWKKEGYAEYISNYKDNYSESGDLKKNALTLLTSKDYFLINEQGIPRPLPYFKSRTLIEYLFFVKGLTFEQIKSDQITEDKILEELTNWVEE
jgi:hypothetical protein